MQSTKLGPLSPVSRSEIADAETRIKRIQCGFKEGMVKVVTEGYILS